jgi:hypothetical protein
MNCDCVRFTPKAYVARLSATCKFCTHHSAEIPAALITADQRSISCATNVRR